MAEHMDRKEDFILQNEFELKYPDEALRVILDSIPRSGTEQTALSAACGRILAEEVKRGR